MTYKEIHKVTENYILAETLSAWIGQDTVQNKKDLWTPEILLAGNRMLELFSYKTLVSFMNKEGQRGRRSRVL